MLVVGLVAGFLHSPLLAAHRWLLGGLALVAGLATPPALAGQGSATPADTRIQMALTLLASQSSTARLPAELERDRVRVLFTTLPTTEFARYSVAERTIEIDDHWASADPTILGAVIAHEGVHVEDALSGALSAPEGCLGSEVRAFRLSAQFWSQVYGPGGKTDAHSALEREMNSVAYYERHDPALLLRQIRTAYAQQCQAVAPNGVRAPVNQSQALRPE